MNSVQCPICGLQLEGDFEDTDEVKCPSCLATFVPSRIRRTTVVSVASRKPEPSAPRRQSKPPVDRGPSRPTPLIWAFAIGLVGEFFLALLATALGSKAALAIAVVFWYPLLIGVFRGSSVERGFLTFLSIIRIGWQLVQLYLFIVGSRTGQIGIGGALVHIVYIAYQILIVCLINMESVSDWITAREKWKKYHH